VESIPSEKEQNLEDFRQSLKRLGSKRQLSPDFHTRLLAFVWQQRSVNAQAQPAQPPVHILELPTDDSVEDSPGVERERAAQDNEILSLIRSGQYFLRQKDTILASSCFDHAAALLKHTYSQELLWYFKKLAAPTLAPYLLEKTMLDALGAMPSLSEISGNSLLAWLWQLALLCTKDFI
jgi:hypothetical protein